MIFRKIIIGRYGTVKTVDAQVAKKYKLSTVSKYPKILKGEKYIVVFDAKDKKLSFYVSEFSYNSYRLNEKGMLKYKGTIIISFE